MIVIRCFSYTSLSHFQSVAFILLRIKQIYSCRIHSSCSQSCILKSGCTSLRWFLGMYLRYSMPFFASSLLCHLSQFDLQLLITQLSLCQYDDLNLIFCEKLFKWTKEYYNKSIQNFRKLSKKEKCPIKRMTLHSQAIPTNYILQIIMPHEKKGRISPHFPPFLLNTCNHQI